MDEVISGHMVGGSRLLPGHAKTLFPEGLTAAQVRRLIKDAYRTAKRIGTQGTDRVLVQGQAGGMTIEMWVNTATKTIETAYPVYR